MTVNNDKSESMTIQNASVSTLLSEFEPPRALGHFDIEDSEIPILNLNKAKAGPICNIGCRVKHPHSSDYQ